MIMHSIAGFCGSPFGLSGLFGTAGFYRHEIEPQHFEFLSDWSRNQMQNARFHQRREHHDDEWRLLSEQARGWAQPTPPKPIDAWAYVLKIRYPARLAFSAYAHKIERSASAIEYVRRVEAQNQRDPLVRRSRLLREAQELLGAMFDEDCPLAQRIRGELRRPAAPPMLGYDNRLANAARRS